jgi:hypothetical protein
VDDKCEFEIGQLVRYVSCYDGDGGWQSFESEAGIILEIITITDTALYKKIKPSTMLYDIKVYWIHDGTIETIPDLLLIPYEINEVVVDEK